MLKEIKKELLNNPQYIINILEIYDFYKPRLKNNEIRCGIAEGHDTTAIRIKLENNENLFVKDFVRNFNYDLITYIIKIRKLEFIDVVKTIKSEIGITDFYSFNTQKSIFGGFYDKIRKHNSELYAKSYDENILNEYQNVYNTRFAKDNISFATQEYFQIGYNLETQRITIPIRNAYGEIIGIKGRANWEVDAEEPKYLYLVSCLMSSTLYGYCQNYKYLVNDDIIIFEAEKSVLQCHSYGIYNCVSLGSNSLSTTQCKLLMELNPKRIIFMLDKDLDYENTKINVAKLSAFTRMSDVQICWWDWTKNKTLPNKSSPSDFGRKIFKDILNNEIVEVIS